MTIQQNSGSYAINSLLSAVPNTGDLRSVCMYVKLLIEHSGLLLDSGCSFLY